MQTAIVTDSTSDLPPELARKHDIHVIPAIIVIADRSYEDGTGISRRAFYEQLPQMKSPPTTASPSAGVFQSLFENLFRKGAQDIISIHIAQPLSGIFNAARLAAEKFGSRVHLVDSGQLTLGLGFQALAAAEAAEAGEPVPGILKKIEEVKRRVRLIAMIDTLEYLRRSGRVSSLKAKLGTLLRVRLFIEVKNGEIIILDQVRTRKKGIRQLKEYLHNLGSLERLAVLHTNSEQDAGDFMAAVGQPSGLPPFLVNVTSVIGSHVGPNALGFAAVLQASPN